MSKLSDRQNMPGLKSLRRRYLGRAKALSETDNFREDVKHWRQKWNQWTHYLIVPAASLEELGASPHIASILHQYVPSSFADDWTHDKMRHPELAELWFGIVDGLANKYFPPKHFSGYSPTYSQMKATEKRSNPAMRFISACFFCDPVIVGRHVDELFVAFSMQVMSLPHRVHASDPYRIAALEAKVDALTEVIESRLGSESASAAAQVSREAAVKAIERLRQRFLTQDASDRWWYIPLFPGISSVDLSKVSGEAVDILRNVYGAQALDELIVELRSQGHAQQEIADTLGVDRDTVRLALKEMPEPDGQSRRP